MTDKAVIAAPVSHHQVSPAWQPVALAAQLAPGSILPIRLNKQDLVLWRAQTGEIAIWEDRCPHRGMRLSFGAVRDANLLCPYHGWTFGTDGQCRHIPAHPTAKPSKAMHPVTYAAAEAQTFIWARTGQSEIVFSPHPGLFGTELTPIRTLHISASMQAVAARLGKLAIVARETDAAGFAKGEIETPGGSLAFVALIQPCDDNACALHIAAIGRNAPVDTVRIMQAFTRFRLTLAAEGVST